MLAWFIHIPLVLSLLIFLYKRNKSSKFSKYFWPALILKIISGISLGIIYFQYYKHGDTIAINSELINYSYISLKNHTEYLRLLFSGETSPEFTANLIFTNQQRVHFFNRIISPLFIFSFNNYWITSIYLSIFSFYGFWYLANILSLSFNIEKRALAISLFFTPGITFWTSGLIKESLVIGSLFLSTGLILEMTEKKQRPSLTKSLLILILLLISFKIKFYYTAVVLAVLPAFFITKKIAGNVMSWKATIVFSTILFSFLLLLSFTNDYLSLNKFAETVYNNYIATLKASKGHNTFTLKQLRPDLISFVKHSPEAIFNGLFRPLPNEIKSWLALPASIENVAIVILSVAAVFNFHKKRKNISVIILPAVSYLLISAAIITIASPNWGTLYRYKSGFLPIFLIIILHGNPLLYFLNRKKLNFLWLKLIKAIGNKFYFFRRKTRIKWN